jgi:hypothetical protein
MRCFPVAVIPKFSQKLPASLILMSVTDFRWIHRETRGDSEIKLENV